MRHYIARSEARAELEEADSFLSVALEEVRRKLAAEARQAHEPTPSSRKSR
jgi:hypothetical protein